MGQLRCLWSLDDLKVNLTLSADGWRLASTGVSSEAVEIACCEGALVSAEAVLTTAQSRCRNTATEGQPPKASSLTFSGEALFCPIRRVCGTELPCRTEGAVA